MQAELNRWLSAPIRPSFALQAWHVRSGMWLGGTSCSLRRNGTNYWLVNGQLCRREDSGPAGRAVSWDQSLAPQTCCKHTLAHARTHTEAHKHWMSPKSISFSSLYLCFIIHSQPSLEAHIRSPLHCAPPTPSLLVPVTASTHTHANAHHPQNHHLSTSTVGLWTNPE